MRTTPEEQHRVSPPLEASLFSSGAGAVPAFSSPSSSPTTSAASSGFQSGIALGFAPLGHHGSTSSPLRSTPLPAFDHSPHHSPSSPSSTSPHPVSPPLPVVDPCFPDTSFPDLPPASTSSPLASPTSLATSSPIPAPPIDLLPPPSPHRTPISLPPPLVAPAPLPPHLGGPPLHNAAPVRHKPSRSKLAAAAAAAAAGGISGSDHAPKKHSPLASPALNGDGEEDEEEKSLGAGMEEKEEESEETQESAEKQEEQQETVEQALEDAESTEMDLGVSSDATVAPSPPVEEPTPSPSASEHQDDTLAEPLPVTSSAPTPSSPPRSGWDMDDASEDEEEDPTTPTGLAADVDEGFASNSPPSSPTTTRLEAAHAEASGDLALARMSRDRPSSLSTSPTTSALQSISLSPNRSGPPPQLHFAAEPHQPGDTSPFGFGGMDLDHEREREGSGAGMEGEGEESSALGLETLDGVDRDEEGEVIAIDEDSLSALERIFICAKSESVEERARVAHNLADWLTAVDICEAAEYVLPLLGGLATDLEEIVKEVFAPQLDRIMWHFFSQCPLVELDGSSNNSSPAGSPVPSRYVPMPSDNTIAPSPTSAHFISDDSGSTSTPPPTSKTSPSNTEISDVPRISVATFTSLLGALLTDQSSLVAKSTESALVRFLCRLKGKPLPTISPPSSPAPEARKSTAICDPADYLRPSADESTHHHHPYDLTPEACRVLEDEFVTGIVLGLARLDDEERDPEKSMDDVDFSSSSTTRRAPSAVPTEDTPPMTLVLSPEEEQIEDGWLAAGAASSGGPFDSQVGPTAESWGEPMTSFFDDGLDRVNGDSSGDAGVMASSSPMEPVYSSFSPDGHGDEESAIGKMVSMSLIGAIAAADCLETEVLVHQILPEVDRMKAEPMFYVRKEATQALGSLARTLPVEVLETVVLPLHAAFARDTLWHVRRAACLTLPAICKRLSPAALRTQAVALIKAFSSDSSRNVRSGALEVCGELTYLFYGDPLGVPDEILAIFLGQATPSTNGNATSSSFASSHASDNVFAPLQSALDSPPETFFDESTDWSSQSLFASSRDPDRPVMCAFNFPAIALTLGGDKWHLLKSYHLELCRDKAPKVRQSLASSLHEIAKIIGSDRSDECLLEPFSWYIRDQDHIQGAMLENVSTLMRSFGIEAGRHALELLNEAWSDIKTWRRREALAEELGNLSAHFMTNGVAEELLGVLGRAFKDHVAAVREKAGGVIPHLFAATASDAITRNKVCAFLAVFSEDASYRNRMTFTSCSLASVREGVDRDIFETYFLPTLSRLSRDKVVNVQIGVARVIGEACRSDSLYADAAERLPLFDILSTLVHSGERDVVAPVAEFHQADSPPPSPGLDAFDRAGAQSRTSNYGQAMEVDGSSGRLPMAARRGHHHGLGDDEDEEMTDASMAGEGEGDLSLDDLGDDVDFDLGDDCEPIFDRPSPSPMQQIWTKELEGDESSFVEVSHR
ncbi:armadillo-type protein [Leucosporidium creatinivorum]|uniref:Armadillo-type protein n=1 Tax=Leucosporidium creatinivorum TaxID=106004 RepID=A0A1Y2D7L7_9BASI|nr:armadillo-type protein [Leucosporidium creatinivorum]